MHKSFFALFFAASLGLHAFSPDQWKDRIIWYGQDSLVFKSEKVVVVDPLKAPEGLKADVILITHSHGDHLNPGVVKKLTKDSTVILAPQDCLSKLGDKARLLLPGQVFEAGGLKITAVPAYNIAKSFHRKESNWLGFLITLEGITFYIAGDTERIPEMKNLDVDVAFLPLGQTYTMGSPAEAAQSALDVRADWAVPVHWGQYEGTAKDVDVFKQELEGKVKVLVLSRQE